MENGNSSDEAWGRGCALLEAIDPGARAEAGAPQTSLRGRVLIFQHTWDPFMVHHIEHAGLKEQAEACPLQYPRWSWHMAALSNCFLWEKTAGHLSHTHIYIRAFKSSKVTVSMDLTLTQTLSSISLWR